MKTILIIVSGGLLAAFLAVVIYLAVLDERDEASDLKRASGRRLKKD